MTTQEKNHNEFQYENCLNALKLNALKEDFNSNAWGEYTKAFHNNLKEEFNNNLKEEFNNNTNDSCCAGGFYFTDNVNAWKYYTLDSSSVYGRLNSLRYLLQDGDNDLLWNEFLLGRSAETLLRRSAKIGYLFGVKIIVEKYPDINIDYALCLSKENGHLHIYEFLKSVKQTQNRVTLYFKITNEKENHNGFQYVTGLNVLKEEFNNDHNKSCCAGGLYFTNAANIFEFLSYGVYLREVTPEKNGTHFLSGISLQGVTLPIDNPDFLMIEDGNKWRANMIILGTRYDLSSVETFKYLIECGADIHACNNYALRLNANYGNLDIVKFLVEKGADVNAEDDYALKCSAENGYLEIVKYLVEKGANVRADRNYAFKKSVENGHLDVIKCLVEKGARIHVGNDYALRFSANNGRKDIYEFLKSKC